MKTPLPTPIGRNRALQGCPEAATPTPPPWGITVCEVTGAIWIERRTDGKKEAVCKMGPNFSEGRDLANAELILSALAESIVLRTACQWALDDAENGGSLKTDTVLALRAAILKATP